MSINIGMYYTIYHEDLTETAHLQFNRLIISYICFMYVLHMDTDSYSEESYKKPVICMY